MSSQLKSLVSSIFTNIDKDLEEITIMKRMTAKVGMRPSHLFLLTTFLIILFALF